MGLKRRTVIGALMVFFMVFSGVATAREIIQGDNCVVEADETLTGNVFVLCRTLVVEGTIDGDLFGAATTAVLMEGSWIHGDVYMLAGQLDILGRLDDDLHFAGVALRIHSTARFNRLRGDVVSLSLSTITLEETTIPGSIVSVGYQLQTHGAVGDEISFWGSALTIDGPVDGDVNATVGDPQSSGVSQLETLLIPFRLEVELVPPGLVVTEGGAITGRLRYTGPAKGEIAGQLAEPEEYTPVEIGPAPLQLGEGDEEEAAGRSLNRYLDSVIREITTLGVIGVIGLLVAPHLLQAPLRDLQARPLSNLGVGMLSFLLSFPIMLIAAVITLVILFILSLFRLQGVMVAGAIILGLVDLGGASLFYFVAIYLARVVVCLAVGRIVVQAAVGDDGSQRIVYISLIAGVAILAVTASLPFVGWLFNAVALFLGLGAILTVLQHQWQRFRETTPTPVTYPAGYPLTFPPLPSRSEDARHIPPPIIDDSDVPPGLDNLPDGFTWWTDD